MKAKPARAGSFFEDAMGDNSGRESWAMVPNSGGELWASDAGQIATLKDGGGFDILPQDMDQFGETYVFFKRVGRGKRIKRSAASMILHAFDQPHVGGRAVGYRDGDTQNLRLENLCWIRKGRPVGNLTPRKCLGHHCGHAVFMSSGKWNQICPVCSSVNASRGDAEGIHVPGEIPDAPSLSPPTTRKG